MSALRLRPLTDPDLDVLWTWMHGTEDPEWKRWDGPYFDPGPTPSRETFDAEQRARRDDPDRRIIEVDGAPVGLVTRFEEEPSGGGWWEVGIIIFDPQRWGRGIGRRALEDWTRLSFEETDAVVITLRTWSGNERMVAAARRVGFVECGRVPEARSWQGRRWDSVVMVARRPHRERWTCTRDAQLPDDVARLLGTVPEWFGIPAANAEYIEAARTKETWSVRDDEGTVVGVTLLDRHHRQAAEVHLTVVDRAHHGQGVGIAMMTAVSEACRRDGVRLLQVKTLGASHPDEGYARTRRFYERAGFLPLEETDLWGEETPCLIMVRPL